MPFDPNGRVGLDGLVNDGYKVGMSDSGPIKCSVITPEEQVVEAEASSVVIPAHDGLIGILKNRAPLVCELGIGVLRINSDEYYVDGGFAQVLDNEVTVLTDRAASSADLVRSEAEEALAEAEQMPAADEVTAESRRKSLQRARVRLKLAKK